MSRARSPQARGPALPDGACALLALLLLAPASARAETTGTESTCESDGDPCRCERDADCWDFSFLSSGPGTRLGVTATLSAVVLPGEDQIDAGALATYRAEIYRARSLLNNHVLATGAIGAGSAGSEGALGGALDFGVRIPVSRTSGPVLRAGPNGWLLGNDTLQLALLEPLRISAGFQWLSSDALLEAGLTTGLLGKGRFAAADRSTSLSGAFELGHYLAAHFGRLRFDGRVIYVQPGPFGSGSSLGIVQLEGCALAHPVAFCGEVRYLQARLVDPASRLETAGRGDPSIVRALYSGLTVGLTP